MKIKTFCLFLFVLCSCSSPIGKNEEKQQVIYDYEDIVDFNIEFNDIFLKDEEQYFVYIYSKTCGHCNQIKNEIISLRIEKHLPIYFLEYNSTIPISDDVSSSINTNSLSDVSILGTPTLLTIYEKTLISNVAGANKILKEIAL